jgi:hypothetical protein
MAGVVPQQRGGSNTSTIVMVASIVTAVVLLGVLVWLITQQEQLRTTADQAVAARNRLASTSDENTAKQMFPGGKTLVAEMNKGVQALCRGIGGSEKDSPQTALAKLEASLSKISADEKVPGREQMVSTNGAAAIVEGLYKLYTTERGNREAAERDLKQAGQDLEAAQARTAELQKNFAAELASINKKVDELQLAKSEFEKVKNTETEALAGQISAKQEALNALRRDHAERSRLLRDELSRSQRLMLEQKQALAALRGPAAEGAQELAIARRPVGRVLRALPGDSLVHIDLGKDDNVTLGMTFTIYSGEERVPADGRGKATVEVVSVGQRTSECRVTTPPAPDDPILEGDGAGNIVLSRESGKKQRFCLVGDFDTDFDGQVDVHGRDAVAALVRRYGGEVVPTVDATTDYLILGIEPKGGPAASAAPAAADVNEKPAAAESAEEEGAVDEAQAEEPAAEEAKPGEEPAEEGTEEAKPEEEESGEEAAAEEGEEKPEAEASEEGEAGEEKAEPAASEPAAEEKKATEPGPEAAPPSEAPRIARAPETDLTAAARSRRAGTERAAYDLAVHRAEQFAIPRLPLDRFYNFVGIERSAATAQPLERY